MNAPNQTIKRHRCQSYNIATSRCSFCRICGVYMSKTSQETTYYRSEKYNVADPFKLDGNMIMAELIKKQGQNRYYNAQAHHLEYRHKLIGFLEEISFKLDYNEATFNLAVAIIDALLSLFAIDRKQIKMACFMALNLAAKMGENNSKIPELNAIAQLFENQFDLEELANCEVLLAKVLNYNLNIKTPHSFIDYFLSKGIVSNKDLGNIPAHQIEEKLIQFEKLVTFFLQISTSHYDFYSFTSIAVATSIIACARKLMGFENIWTEDLQNLTHVSLDSIEQCSMMLYEAAEETYPILTSQVVLGNSIEDFECPELSEKFRSRGSIFTEATSEKDEHNEENIQISEFTLYDSEDDRIEPEKFSIPFDLNCC